MYQPAQLARRARAALAPALAGYVPLATGWGVRIVADPSRAIGRSILTTGIFDLAVSEALARLISPGDTVIDAGANVGYMTVLAALAAGPRGRVLAFEPHPELFAVLQRNVAAARDEFAIAHTELHETALGATTGSAHLQCPVEFASNDGLGRIASTPEPAGGTLTVRMQTLDTALGNRRAAVLKLDVEGAEAQVLRGAAGALGDRRIAHVVFEDHDMGNSEVVRILRDAGYSVFSLGWAMTGPRIAPVGTARLASEYEAPSFLATLDPSDVLARWRVRGWRVFSRRLGGTRP